MRPLPGISAHVGVEHRFYQRYSQTTGRIRRFSTYTVLRQDLQEPQEDDRSAFKYVVYRSAVIASNFPERTSPDELVAQIEPLDQPLNAEHRKPAAVFLLTPSFSRWLLDDEVFLAKALKRVFRRTINDPSIAKSITAVVGVVDRLPAPSKAWGVNRVVSTRTRRAKPPIAEEGFEGLAYATLNAELLEERSLMWRDSNDSNDMSHDAPRTLSLMLRPSSKAIDSLREPLYPSYQIQLPLANTVFHTGEGAILFASEWIKLETSCDLRLVEKLPLAGLMLHLPKSIHEPLHGKHHSLVIAAPLLPLTAPRRIEAAMGNIIRRIGGLLDSESLPASQELEEAMASYFKARNVAPRAMTVWALVIPPDLFTALKSVNKHITARMPQRMREMNTEESSGESTVDSISDKVFLTKVWQMDPPLWEPRLLRFLQKGARLHRVLSGGGGWGKKAGLLSLDPDASYTGAATSASYVFGLALDLADEEDMSRGQVVKSGDYVQFFVSENTASTTEDTSESRKEEADRELSIDFGTIPSSIDNMPGETGQTESACDRPKFETYPRHFGALSERGISLLITEHNPQTGESREVTQSKVDVPYSRLSVLEFKSPKPKAASVQKKTRVADSQISDKSIRPSPTVDPKHKAMKQRSYRKVRIKESSPKKDLIEESQSRVPSQHVRLHQSVELNRQQDPDMNHQSFQLTNPTESSDLVKRSRTNEFCHDASETGVQEGMATRNSAKGVRAERTTLRRALSDNGPVGRPSPNSRTYHSMSNHDRSDNALQNLLGSESAQKHSTVNVIAPNSRQEEDEVDKSASFPDRSQFSRTIQETEHPRSAEAPLIRKFIRPDLFARVKVERRSPVANASGEKRSREHPVQNTDHETAALVLRRSRFREISNKLAKISKKLARWRAHIIKYRSIVKVRQVPVAGKQPGLAEVRRAVPSLIRPHCSIVEQTPVTYYHFKHAAKIRLINASEPAPLAIQRIEAALVSSDMRLSKFTQMLSNIEWGVTYREKVEKLLRRPGGEILIRYHKASKLDQYLIARRLAVLESEVDEAYATTLAFQQELDDIKLAMEERSLWDENKFGYKLVQKVRREVRNAHMNIMELRKEVKRIMTAGQLRRTPTAKQRKRPAAKTKKQQTMDLSAQELEVLFQPKTQPSDIRKPSDEPKPASLQPKTSQKPDETRFIDRVDASKAPLMTIQFHYTRTKDPPPPKIQYHRTKRQRRQPSRDQTLRILKYTSLPSPAAQKSYEDRKVTKEELAARAWRLVARKNERDTRVAARAQDPDLEKERRQGRVRGRERRARLLDPEAKKLADSVAQLLKGF